MGWGRTLPPLHGEGKTLRSSGAVGRSDASTKARARRLRSNLTPQEARLWLQLRALEGVHFRRQAPFKGFYLDFVSFKHRLVVEVDGSQHADDDQADHDAMRDAILSRAGFRTLRFWNSDINLNLDGVMLAILQALEESAQVQRTAPDIPTRPASRSYPPHEGEGG